jgi:hypothetical protein
MDERTGEILSVEEIKENHNGVIPDFFKPIPLGREYEMSKWGKKKREAYFEHLKSGLTEDESYDKVINFKIG